MSPVHQLQLCTMFVFWETFSASFWIVCFYYFVYFVLMLLFVFLNFKLNHHYCNGLMWDGCLCLCDGIMPINIEQWHAEIGRFYGCSNHCI